MTDPHIVPELLRQLEHEQREASAFQEEKHPGYRDSFGAVARALAGQGNSRGADALARYDEAERYWKERPI